MSFVSNFASNTRQGTKHRLISTTMANQTSTTMANRQQHAPLQSVAQVTCHNVAVNLSLRACVFPPGLPRLHSSVCDHQPIGRPFSCSYFLSLFYYFWLFFVGILKCQQHAPVCHGRPNQYFVSLSPGRSSPARPFPSTAAGRSD